MTVNHKLWHTNVWNERTPLRSIILQNKTVLSSLLSLSFLSLLFIHYYLTNTDSGVTSSWYPWSQVRINEEVFIRKGILTLAMPWEIRIQPSFLLLVFYYYYHHISVCSTIYSCVYSYYHYLIRENLRDYFLQLCHKHLHTAKWTEKMTHRSFMKSEMK